MSFELSGRVDGLRGSNKPWAIEVATLVWQGWKVEAISTWLGIPVERLEEDFSDELKNGANIIEGRVACELVKRALGGDDKSLHLLARSKFGFNEPPKDGAGMQVMGLGLNLTPEGENALVAAVRGLEEKGSVRLDVGELEVVSVPPKGGNSAPKGRKSSPKLSKRVKEKINQEITEREGWSMVGALAQAEREKLFPGGIF